MKGFAMFVGLRSQGRNQQSDRLKQLDKLVAEYQGRYR